MAINYPQSVTAGSVIYFKGFGSSTVATSATITQNTGASGSNSSTIGITDLSTNITGSSLYGALPTAPLTPSGGSGVCPGVKFTNGIEVMNNDYLWTTAVLASGVGS